MNQQQNKTAPSYCLLFPYTTEALLGRGHRRGFVPASEDLFFYVFLGQQGFTA